MDIKELIALAISKSPEFEFKYEYWTEQRRKPPGFNWLMSNLEEVLGRDYVQEQATKHIKSQQKRD